MLEARRPENESERLAALEKMHILDTPLDPRFERITRLACQLLGVPIASFSLIDDNRQWLKSVQGLNATESPRSMSVCAHVILNDEVLMIPNAKEDERFFDHPLVTGDANIGFYAGCPVYAPDGSKIGTFCAMDTQPKEFCEGRIQILRDLALLVETELKVVMLSKVQAELVDNLDAARRRALIDPLTRLWNRDGMAELLKREWGECNRSRKNIAVVVGDIDHFKKVNDTYGHLVGDAVLQGVSRHLLSALRPMDIVGRFGGEEFLIAMPDCDPAELEQVVDRVRLFIEQFPIATSSGDLHVTMSFGAASAVPSAAISFSDLLRQADSALYLAKAAGRNCIKIAP